jgi:hypothetical protein
MIPLPTPRRHCAKHPGPVCAFTEILAAKMGSREAESRRAATASLEPAATSPCDTEAPVTPSDGRGRHFAPADASRWLGERSDRDHHHCRQRDVVSVWWPSQ